MIEVLAIALLAYLAIGAMYSITMLRLMHRHKPHLRKLPGAWWGDVSCFVRWSCSWAYIVWFYWRKYRRQRR